MEPLDDNAQIKIKNKPGFHPWKDVKALVVKIGKDFYLRTDEDLVKVPNAEGKVRFFRSDSPFLVKLADGKFIHKENAVRTEDGIFLEKNSPDLVYVDGKPTRLAYCIKYKDKYYLRSDKRFTTCSITGATIFLEDKDSYIEVTTFRSTSEKPQYVVKSEMDRSVVQGVDGKIYYKKHCYHLINPKTGEIEMWHEHLTRTIKMSNEVFYEFQDKTNPQETRIVFYRSYGDWESHFKIVDFLEGVGGGRSYYVHETRVDYVKQCINDYIMPRFLTEIEKARKKINDKFSDLDASENIAKKFTVLNGNFGGKQNIHTPPLYGSKVVNILEGKKINEYKFTGGLQYSFGAEFETSQGLIPNSTLDVLNLMAVGDRSVGAAEYVTRPLCGDAGVNALKKYAEALSNNTLVDDRCGLHFHVGGLTKETSPSFNKEFHKNAINLGCFLEEEIYKAMPPSRTPTLYHCHSIRRFGPVTEKNYSENMGAFIFGEKEKWVDAKGKPLSRLFKFSDYALGSERNAKSQVGTWADGRYKWLNLINSFLTTNHKTIEFRIFPGTVSYQKIYGYLLLSLAFTHVVDNVPKLIYKGVTLDDIFAEAFKGYPSVIDFASAFYHERIKKFNRKNIYPDCEALTFLK